MNKDDVPAAVLRRRELIAAFRRCTWRQRKYLRELVQCDFKPYGPCRKLGINQALVARWRKDMRVRKAVELLEECALDDLCVSARKVLAEFNLIAFADIGDLYGEAGNLLSVKEVPAHARKAIKELTWTKDGPKIVLHDKLHALDKLADYVKLSSKSIDVTSGGKPIAAAPVINIVRYDDDPTNAPAT